MSALTNRRHCNTGEMVAGIAVGTEVGIWVLGDLVGGIEGV